jgi:hypothetical protein
MLPEGSKAREEEFGGAIVRERQMSIRQSPKHRCQMRWYSHMMTLNKLSKSMIEVNDTTSASAAIVDAGRLSLLIVPPDQSSSLKPDRPSITWFWRFLPLPD